MLTVNKVPTHDVQRYRLNIANFRRNSSCLVKLFFLWSESKPSNVGCWGGPCLTGARTSKVVAWTPRLRWATMAWLGFRELTLFQGRSVMVLAGCDACCRRKNYPVLWFFPHSSEACFPSFTESLDVTVMRSISPFGIPWCWPLMVMEKCQSRAALSWSNWMRSRYPQ